MIANSSRDEDLAVVAARAPLLSLFRMLSHAGVPLGVRDYLDGLRALQFGFGAGDRDQLRTIVLALWARTVEERRLVSRWFDALPSPMPTLVEDLSRSLDDDHDLLPQRQETTKVQSDDLAPPVHDDVDGIVAGAREPGEYARIAFATLSEGSGIPMPRLSVDPKIGENYALDLKPAISVRHMATIWRRFRRPTRSGFATELDIGATVRERCSKGLLLKPVRRPRRRNAARLAVLIDASDSMAPWAPFASAVAESLDFSRFASADVRYFRNVPRKRVHVTPELEGGEPWETFLQRNAGAALLLISDAGSARGLLNWRRAAQTDSALKEASRFFASMVWLNPMPSSRWEGTTAAVIATESAVTMLPLDRGELMRAVDILRGNR